MQFRSRRHPALGNRVGLTGAGPREREATLIDVSEGGARLALDGPPPPVGARLCLRAARLELGATLRWAARGEVGIAFDRPIDDRQVRELSGKRIAPGGRAQGDRWLYGH